MRRLAQRSAIAISSVFGLVLAIACAVSFGDYPVDRPDAAGDATSSGGWPNVDAGECVCAPAPSTDWAGPIVLVSGAQGADVECPAGFAAQTPDLNRDLMLGCQACTCSPSCGHDLEFFGGSTCSSSIGVNDATETCTSGTVPNVTGVSVKTNITCIPSPEQPAPAAPSWATVGKRCAPASAACQGGSTCMPAPADGEICIQASGDVPCPSGSDYSEKRLFYGGFAGTHSCTPCTCTGNATPADCGPVHFFGAGCNQEQFQCTPDSECCVPAPAPANVDGWRADGASVDHCQPLGGAPTPGSEPERTDPTTFCCLPAS